MAAHQVKNQENRKAKSPAASQPAASRQKTADPQPAVKPETILIGQDGPVSASLTPGAARQLQRAVGNQVMGQWGKQGEETAVSSAQASLTAIQANSAAIARQVLKRQEDDEEVDRKTAVSPVGQAGGPVSADLETSIQQARSGGRPLDDAVRQPMEQLFQADFGGVKIHTDATAETLNRSLNARAFTTGQDIFFSPGAYQPESSAGQELLAHELTHVVQQNGGAPQTKLLVSQPGDRDEQEAEEVGRLVAKHGTAVHQLDPDTPVAAKIQTMKAVQGTVQRGFGGKVALAIGKGILMSFVKALAGPLMYFSRGQRRDIARNWRDYGNREKYVSGHLERMGKASMVFQQIGALAGWISLLTGVGSLIAAAFAPAGLGVSAVLGSISAISGLVAAGAGAVTFGLSIILFIQDIARALALPKNSLQRKQLIIAAIKDGSAALSGLIAAVGGVVGAAIGGFQITQTAGDVGKTLAEKGFSGLATDLAIGSGAGQAFALSDEVQGEVGGLYKDKAKKELKTNPRYGQWRMGKQAMEKRAEILKVNKASLPVQRAPEEGEQADYSGQVLQELSKVATAAQAAQNINQQDKAGLDEEKGALTAVGPDLEKANSGMAQIKGAKTAENLQQIEKQSSEGEAKAASGDDLERAEPRSESEAEAKVSKLEEAEAAINKLEAQSGEQFGQKQGFFGKLRSKAKRFFGRMKRGAKKVGRLFASAFLGLKQRVKAIFGKIRVKVAQFLIKVTGLNEPLQAVDAELQEARQAAPASLEGTAVAEADVAANEGQVGELQEAIQKARETIGA